MNESITYKRRLLKLFECLSSSLWPYLFTVSIPLSAGGVEPPTKFSRKVGGFPGSQFLDGVAGKEGVERMFFSVITNNLNWEIVIKNLVTFKRWDGVKDEKINFGVQEKPIYRWRIA